MHRADVFASHFPQARQILEAHCPYRVCPLGAHIDHQYGLVTGFALDHGVTLHYAVNDAPSITLHSMNFPGEVRFALQPTLARAHDWGDYARAAAAALMAHGYTLTHGLVGVIEGTLPVGGLSSSAAVVITYLCALCHIHRIALTPPELIALALWAENQYIGLSVGKLDQSCEVYCRKEHLLYLDAQNDHVEQIAQHPGMPPYRLAVLFSGVARALVDSAYNARVDECKAAAYALKAFEGMPYARFADTRLRDVPQEVFEAHQHKLPENWRKRASHYYTEAARVQAGIAAWRRGDLSAFGQAIFASCHSSIYHYECGSPELRTLYEIMLETPGVYGGRFSGAGFKGCCMAVVDPAQAEQIEERITARYLDAFPAYRDSFSIHFCQSADGVHLA